MIRIANHKIIKIIVKITIEVREEALRTTTPPRVALQAAMATKIMPTTSRTMKTNKIWLSRSIRPLYVDIMKLVEHAVSMMPALLPMVRQKSVA